MSYALGIEQDCGECRMCGNGKGGLEMESKFKQCNSCAMKCPPNIRMAKLNKGRIPFDKCMDYTPIQNNADRIRNMTNEELEESRIDRIDIYCKSDTQMWIGDFAGVAESKEEALRLEKEWLESEFKDDKF